MNKDTILKVISDHAVDIEDFIIHLNGDVSDEMYDHLVQGVALIEAANGGPVDELTIYLSTYGGDVYYGFAIYDFLKLSSSKIRIVATGPVMSAGVLILQAADERIMMPNSHILVHFGMEVNDNQQTKHQHDLLTRELKRLLIERCTAKEETVKKWFSKESYFDKKRALSVGLVDKVVSYG